MTIAEYTAAYPKAVEEAYNLVNAAQIKLTCPNEYNCPTAQ